MLTASGTATPTNDREVSLKLTENKVRFLLTVLRTRQDECRKVTQEYPRHVYNLYNELDVTIEQLKLEIAGQI